MGNQERGKRRREREKVTLEARGEKIAQQRSPAKKQICEELKNIFSYGCASTGLFCFQDFKDRQNYMRGCAAIKEKTGRNGRVRKQREIV